MSQRSTTRRGPLRAPVTAVALVASFAVVSACSAAASANDNTTAGSGTGLSSGSVSAIQSLLKDARKAPVYKVPGAAVDATSLAGKSVFVLNDGTNQFSQSFAAGMETSGKALGLHVKIGSGNSVTTQDEQVIDNAVSAGVSAIIIDATDPHVLSSAIAKAKAAGIPVIETFQGDPGLPPADLRAAGVVANATYCYSCTGKLMAASELLRSGDKVVGAVQEEKGQLPSDGVVKGWDEAMSEWCPSCKTTYQDIPVTATNTQQMTNAAQVAAQRSTTTVLAPVYDYMIAYEEPAVKAAGASSRIDLVSENADLAQMQDLKSGGSVKVDVGNPVEWDGWGAMDEAVRAMLGKPVVANENLPVREFDTTNIASLNLNADPATWYGGTDYQTQYEKLWGLK